MTVLLVAAAVAAAVWLYGLVQPLTFVGREWDLAVERRGWSADVLLAPWDGGIGTVPIALYNVLFAWKGLLTYNHYAAMLVASHLGAVAIVAAVAFMRGGPIAGAVAGAALLVLAAAYDVLLWPASVGVPIAVGAGAVAWAAWAPERQEARHRWLGGAALAVAVAAHPVGLAFLGAGSLRAILSRPRDPVRLGWAAMLWLVIGAWLTTFGGDLEVASEGPLGLLVSWSLAIRDGTAATVGSLGVVGAEHGVLLAILAAAGLGIAVGRRVHLGPGFWVALGAAAAVHMLAAGTDDGAQGAEVYASTAFIGLAVAEAAGGMHSRLADPRLRTGLIVAAIVWIVGYGATGIADLEVQAAAWRDRTLEIQAALITMQLYPELVDARGSELVDRDAFGGLTFGAWREVHDRLGAPVPGLTSSITRRGERARLAADRHASRLASVRLEPAFSARGPRNEKILEADFRAGGGAVLVDHEPPGCGRFHVGGDDPHIILSVAGDERVMFRSDGRLETQVFHAMFGPVHQEAASSRRVLEPESWYLVDPPPAPDGEAWRIRVDPPQDALRVEVCLLAAALGPPVAVDARPFVAGLDDPVGFAHAGDGSGRLFVLERPGRVRVISGTALVADPFLDIVERVTSGGEQGLLGIAFHPAFPDDPRLFVTYVDLDGDVRLSEFATTDGWRADPESERVLLTVPQPTAQHNGGMLAFGPDGYLYASSGDGTFDRSTGMAGTGQEPDTLLGVLIRIDVDRVAGGRPYAIPDDNPRIDGRVSEVWAYGLRNPWRFSFDRDTGDLWISDVGQRDREEINFQPADSQGGENYGWSIMEGTRCYFEPDCETDGLMLPVAEYRHFAGNCAVVGGFVYRGRAHPQLVGRYLYSDFCSGEVWALDGPSADAVHLFSTGRMISSFGEDEDGELYVAAIFDGAVLRITADAP